MPYTRYLTLDFKRYHQKYDLVMVQANVPLGRDPDLDLVRINNCPDSIDKKDCRLVEQYFISKIGAENAYDLAVRKFKDSKRDDNQFLIIFVGRCRCSERIRKMIKHEGIQIHRKGKNERYKVNEGMNRIDFVFE